MRTPRGEPKSSTTLLGLPTEIRVQILSFFAPQEVCIRFVRRRNGEMERRVDVVWSQDGFAGFNLLLVCRCLRQDLLPILYGTPIFEFRDLASAVEVSRLIGVENSERIRSVIINPYAYDAGEDHKILWAPSVGLGGPLDVFSNLDLIRLVFKQDDFLDNFRPCRFRSRSRILGDWCIPYEVVLRHIVDRRAEFNLYYDDASTCVKLARIAGRYDVPDEEE